MNNLRPKIRLPKPCATNPYNPNRKQSAELEENHIENHTPRPNKMPPQPLIRSSTQYIGAKTVKNHARKTNLRENMNTRNTSKQ